MSLPLCTNGKTETALTIHSGKLLTFLFRKYINKQLSGITISGSKNVGFLDQSNAVKSAIGTI